MAYCATGSTCIGSLAQAHGMAQQSLNRGSLLCPHLPLTLDTCSRRSKSKSSVTCALASDEKEEKSDSVDETTRKFGLEAGLWKIFTSKDESKEDGAKNDKKNQAKVLLARYGGAYLATSISLSLVSFTLCYVLINSGVDVSVLLQKIGIQTNETGEKVGTFALAYAAHKAASPIRFPPTVALTTDCSFLARQKNFRTGRIKLGCPSVVALQMAENRFAAAPPLHPLLPLSLAIKCLEGKDNSQSCITF